MVVGFNNWKAVCRSATRAYVDCMIGPLFIDLFSALRNDSLLLLGRELKFLFGPLNGSLAVRSLDLAYVLSLCADDVDAPGVLLSQKSFLGRETGPPSGEPASIFQLESSGCSAIGIPLLFGQRGNPQIRARPFLNPTRSEPSARLDRTLACR